VVLSINKWLALTLPRSPFLTKFLFTQPSASRYYSLLERLRDVLAEFAVVGAECGGTAVERTPEKEPPAWSLFEADNRKALT
jgi:hypothetical protein